jgi:DNA-directed RNA polymerase subunit RPC12/RpoP
LSTETRRQRRKNLQRAAEMASVINYPCSYCKHDVYVDSREADGWHVRCPACGLSDTLIPNRPTELGRAAGVELARLTDAAEVKQLKKFPNMRERCVSCAFRAGTIPNGCEETLVDAVEAITTGRAFKCHMGPKDEGGNLTELCIGWMLAMSD